MIHLRTKLTRSKKTFRWLEHGIKQIRSVPVQESVTAQVPVDHCNEIEPMKNSLNELEEELYSLNIESNN